MDKITSSIKDFYNKQAEKFSQTRQKHWPEFDFILEEIKKYPKKNIKILELGCWDGRLERFLQEKLKQKNIEYVWVDLSENLIQIANMKKYNPKSVFIAENMVAYLIRKKQQQYDFIIAVASFQHIPSATNRIFVLESIYKYLKYTGKCIMINWSFSKWFLKKYKVPVFKSLLKYILTLWYLKINDLYIPWKDKDITYYRYYHIFFLQEIKNLFKRTNFIVEKCLYIDKSWKLTDNFSNARNSLIVGVKDIVRQR